MKSKPRDKTNKTTETTNHPTQRHWHEMNHKQRREMTRQIQSEDLSLEVVHPDAAGIDIGNESPLCGGTPEPRQPNGTALRMHHRRVKDDGQLAEAMQDSDCRDRLRFILHLVRSLRDVLDQ